MSAVSNEEHTTARRALGLIDLTSLGPDDDEAMIDALCANAVTAHGPVAAICVWPRFVGRAVGALTPSSGAAPIGPVVPVAGVANFPDGSTDADRAVADAGRIVAAGGREVDVVLPWRALADGDHDAGRRLVTAVRASLGPDIGLKVILETGELAEPALIRAAADLALDAGADFLKTSTGKTPISATPAAAEILLEAISARTADGRPVAGLKVSGGIRTVAEVGPYLDLADRYLGPGRVDAATFRIGASSLLADVLRVLDTEPNPDTEPSPDAGSGRG